MKADSKIEADPQLSGNSHTQPPTTQPDAVALDGPGAARSGPRSRRWQKTFALAFVGACVVVAIGLTGVSHFWGMDWPGWMGGHADRTVSYERIIADDPSSNPPMLLMEWEETHGTVRRLVVDRAAMQQFVISRKGAVDRDREILREIGARYLRARVEATFTRMKRRIRTYTTWMYGWAASYVKAYTLIGRGLWRSANLIAEGKIDTLSADLELEMTGFIMEEFRETVIKPEESDAEIAQGWWDTLDFVAVERLRLREKSHRDFETFIAHQRVQGRRIEVIVAAPSQRRAIEPTPGAEAGKLATGLTEASPTEGALGRKEVVDSIVGRSVRPWVSRVVGITLQSAAAGTAAAATGATVPVVGPALGLVLGVSTFLAYHWSFDFIVNEIDEGLNRDTLEATLKSAIDSVRISVTQGLNDRLQDHIDQELMPVGGQQTPLGLGFPVRLRMLETL